MHSTINTLSYKYCTCISLYYAIPFTNLDSMQSPSHLVFVDNFSLVGTETLRSGRVRKQMPEGKEQTCLRYCPQKNHKAEGWPRVAQKNWSVNSYA